MAEAKAKVDSDTCIDCGVCVDTCPEEAISME
jgi:NAD-dependent dihydropyrimidine dehydrogenase PreA subunit